MTFWELFALVPWVTLWVAIGAKVVGDNIRKGGDEK